MNNVLRLKGVFKIEHFRKGKIINSFEVKNGTVTEGLNKILDVMFHGVSALPTWYVGLVDNSGFTAFASADTMASHAGWSESTAYTEATRGEWTEGAASGGSITNSVSVDFSINATVALKGIFVCSDSVKGGTSGTLWATSAFAAVVNAQNGDMIKITYTVSVS